MSHARDLILEVIEDKCFEPHSTGAQGTLGYLTWYDCIECKEQSTDIELIDHDMLCIVGKVEEILW